MLTRFLRWKAAQQQKRVSFRCRTFASVDNRYTAVHDEHEVLFWNPPPFAAIHSYVTLIGANKKPTFILQ